MIGLPVAYHLDDELFRVFTEVGQAAWLAACDKREVSALSVKVALSKAERTNPDSGLHSEDEDVEVSIVPEIAAQILPALVKPSRFDKKAPNLYLLAKCRLGKLGSLPRKAGQGRQVGF